MFDTQNNHSNQTKADQDQTKAGQEKSKVRHKQPNIWQTLRTAISTMPAVRKTDKALALVLAVTLYHPDASCT